MNYTSASFILSAALVIYTIQILSYWQVFYKAGYEGWKCLIPIYNFFIMTKIARLPLGVFILLIIPALNILGVVLLSLGVARAFGKGALFAVFGLILLPFFGYMYLGWGKSEYKLALENK